MHMPINWTRIMTMNIKHARTTHMYTICVRLQTHHEQCDDRQLSADIVIVVNHLKCLSRKCVT